MERFQIHWLALVGWVGVLAAVPAQGAGGGDTFSSVAPGGVLRPTDNLNLGPPGQSGPTASRTHAGDWTVSARAVGTLTLTDNVNLAPPGAMVADQVLGLSVPLGLRREGSRVKFRADYVPTVYTYARSKDQDNLQNNLTSLLSLEAVDNFLFVDASANIYETYISPFSPRPDSGASTTQNRTQQTTLGLSPYISHERKGGWTYVIRNDNFLNLYSAQGLAASRTNRISADIESPPAQLRYGFDYSYQYVRDQSQPNGNYEQVVRVRPILGVTPRLNVSARLGYETNDYVTTYSGPVYGAGIAWTPTPRTKLDGFVEHRFFGPSYGLNFNHRTRLTAWRLSATRDAYTTLEQPLILRPGTTAEVLDEALRPRISDPVQRQQAVNQLLQQEGLPPGGTQPYSFYTNQTYVAQQWTGSVALLGKINTATLTFIWQENEPITTGGTVLPAGFTSSNGFRQRGISLSFSHRLSGFSNITLTANRLYSATTGPVTSPVAAQPQSIQDTLLLSLTHQLSPKTYGSIGVRWARSDLVTSPYHELALIAGLGHSF